MHVNLFVLTTLMDKHLESFRAAASSLPFAGERVNETTWMCYLQAF